VIECAYAALEEQLRKTAKKGGKLKIFLYAAIKRLRP